ncbi:hypothetical protein ACJDU8_18040 [Clostridium sp. WILCCON 0269]|uniref:Uncharacterized protein n=1 Tax=Candidatus Clostridium eludens TaxID=3381663 RepID=A0ABW8SN17_9CLOT
MKLDVRYVLTIKEEKEEYNYGQLIVVEDILYFSEKCIKNDKIMQFFIVNQVILRFKGSLLMGNTFLHLNLRITYPGA